MESWFKGMCWFYIIIIIIIRLEVYMDFLALVYPVC